MVTAQRGPGSLKKTATRRTATPASDEPAPKGPENPAGVAVGPGERGEGGGPAAEGDVLRGAELRGEAWPLLAAGKTVSQTAKRLRVKHQRISDAAAWMVRQSFLKPVAPGANPMIYSRGSRAAVMDRLAEAAGSGPWGSVTPRVPIVARVHRGQFRWVIDGAPSRPPLPIKHSTPSGVPTFTYEVGHAGRTYTIVEKRGRTVQSLSIYAPEEFTTDPAVAGLRQRVRVEEVAHMVRAFAAEHGYVLRGALQEVQRPEVGYAAPGLPKFGTPGQGVWVDGSGVDADGNRVNELETNEPAAAEAFLRLPDFMDQTDRQLQRIMATLERLAVEARTLAEASEKVSSIQAGQDRTLVSLLQSQVTSVAASAVAAPLPTSNDRTGYA